MGSLTTMEKESKENAEQAQMRFCALAYNPQPWSTRSLPVEPVILFVFQDEGGGLRFRVSPGLSQIVRDEGLAYIESLLKDFVERSKTCPGGLFQQLCSLAVGPLVTVEVGSRLSEHPRLQELSSHFTPF